MKTQKRILVAILNWGLGHATRCMPIINQLIQHNIEPIVASDGRALLLLQKEYPTLKTIELPAYNVTYKSQNMLWNIAPQVPRILKAIQQEQIDIQKIISIYKIDGIISDNRFGCYSKDIPSVFITHQVNIKTPFALGSALVNLINHRFISQYNICWIPDTPTLPNLAGTLSDGSVLKSHQYIGILSRFKYQALPKKYDIAIVLSGPEPQRTYLEEKLLQQIQNTNYKIVLIKGKTDENDYIYKKNLTIYSFLTAQKLNEVMLQSDIIITRSGYSTLMDLVYLKKKAILIPTPGQTEQEYLAQHFHQEKIFYSTHQNNFDLKTALHHSEHFTGFQKDNPNNYLEIAINHFIKQIQLPSHQNND